MSCNNVSPDADIPAFDKMVGAAFASPPMPMQAGPATRRVHLTWAVSAYHYHSTDGIRVRIEAGAAENMPSKIFAYLMLPLEPGTTERAGAFDHVCSPTDLEEYPADEPIPNVRPEWFRLDYVDVIVRSRAEAYAFIRDVAADVHVLKTTLDVTDRIEPAGEIWIGGEPESSSSSRSSSSSSSPSSSSSGG